MVCGVVGEQAKTASKQQADRSSTQLTLYGSSLATSSQSTMPKE